MKFFLILMIMMADVAYAADDYVPGEVLVQYKSGKQLAVHDILRSKIKASMKKSFSKFRVEQWHLSQGMSVEAAVEQLKADPNIAFAEPNYRRYPRAIPNDPGFVQQWALQNTGQTINNPIGTVIGTPGADMALTTAWNTTTGSANVVVAVIDDSVDIHHADLYANIWTNPGEIAGNGIDDDGNGYVDDVHGWDFLKNDNDPSADPYTSEGHGTMVAGCIGATGNNGVGVSGVNQTVSIMPLKFAFDVATELESMQYAINNGAHIVNASWGGPQFSLAESGGIQLLQNAGILLVTAAGNYDTNNDLIADYPSSLPNPNIIAVAASDANDTLVDFTHYGAVSVDLAAPGVDVYTTSSPTNSPFVSYEYVDGTSFSSPYVAGIAALVKARYPTATFQEMKGRILGSVTPQNAMQGFLAASGTANAAAALAIAPQPVLVIKNIAWVDGGNSWPDAGETATLDIQLENIWQMATGVSATLTSLSTNLTILTANATYPDLPADTYASPSTQFSVQVAPGATGYQVYQVRLDITAAGGYTVSRYYRLGMGSLQNGVTYTGTLMTTPYDDFQEFHIDVPAGASNLTIATTSGQDVDLLVNPVAVPQFDYLSYWWGGVDRLTQVSANTLPSNDSILIPSPKSGGYYITVIDASKLTRTGQANNYSYGLTVSYNLPVQPAPQPAVASSTNGGGGCIIQTHSLFDPLWLLMLMMPLYIQWRKMRKARLP